MPKINKYVDIDTVEREAKKDLIDRHSPFITVEGEAKKGEMLAVNVKMGQEYTHPDDSILSLLHFLTVIQNLQWLLSYQGHSETKNPMLK